TTSGTWRPSALCQHTDFFMPKAINPVVVNHADRLHKGVADRGAHEAEASRQEILAQCIRDLSARRHVTHFFEGALDGTAIHETPEVRIETAKLLLHCQVGLRI